jgi:YD repeat-containing protein
MRISYDPETDTLDVILRDAPVAESDESRQGVILDYDEEGNLLSIEVLRASQRVEQPDTVTWTLKPQTKTAQGDAVVRRRACPHRPTLVQQPVAQFAATCAGGACTNTAAGPNRPSEENEDGPDEPPAS